MDAIVRDCPNLFIIGAMKCATTTLHTHLNMHPAVMMSTPKEPSYFLHEMPESERRKLYSDLFADATDEEYLGESSTGYTSAPEHPEVPIRIAQNNPDSRLIFIMRDPVERAISQYRHYVRARMTSNGLYRSMIDNPVYVNKSNYAMQLERYFQLFDSRNICCLTFEEYTQYTDVVINELCEWLSIDATITWPSRSIHKNKTYPVVLDRRKAGRLYPIFRSPWIRKLGRFPAISRLRDYMKRRYGVTTELEDDEIARTIEYLRPIQLPQVEELEKMLGRSFSMWTTLYGT